MIEDIEISQLSAVAGHGSVQYGGSEWHIDHCAQYYTYLIPNIPDLPDAIVFAYEDSIHDEFRGVALSVNKLDGSEEADVDVQDREHESFEENNDLNLELSHCNLKTITISE